MRQEDEDRLEARSVPGGRIWSDQGQHPTVSTRAARCLDPQPNPMLTIRELTAEETSLVDRCLPLSRLHRTSRRSSTYLVASKTAFRSGSPTYLARTRLRLPEIKDVYVSPDRRRQVVATLLAGAAEISARRARGCARMSLSVSAEGNPTARRLYERLGYRDGGVPPFRTLGVITLRASSSRSTTRSCTWPSPSSRDPHRVRSVPGANGRIPRGQAANRSPP